MLFNSLDFAFFLPIVFLLYWFVFNKNLRVQNLLLLAASYFFYGWWDWRFLTLIFFSSLVDFFVGIYLGKEKTPSKRKWLLLLSVFVNLGFLGFFKYFNFFAASFADAFTLFGGDFQATRLEFILPVGISFYTFQTLSYSIDIFQKKLEPTKDPVVFFSFVSFFPQLVAGPIERATNLLPQFHSQRVFDKIKAADGMRQILWGLFKKMVIADNCAPFVDDIFSNYTDYSGSTLLLGAVFFAFQIYCDFSGYSDIAIGTARLFGFRLMRNFAFPYFSRDIAEFWRRWHISLSTWFRDYVYIPLGGSRGSTFKKIRNIFIIFLVSGFWHGANWTYLMWGFVNACFFLPLLLLQKNRKNTNVVAEGKMLPTVKEFFQIIITFLLVVLAWVFFRADSIGDAFNYLQEIFSESLFTRPNFANKHLMSVNYYLIYFMIIIEWVGRQEEHAIAKIGSRSPRMVRWSFYAVIIFLIGMFTQTNETPFIYFQF